MAGETPLDKIKIFIYNTLIMKTTNYKQVKNIRSGETFVTSGDWPEKIIEGKTFITVKRRIDDQATYLMSKDGVEISKFDLPGLK